MAQDFAKRRAPSKSKSKKPGSRKTSRAATRAKEKSESGWSWFFTGLCTGLFLAFIVYLAVLRPEVSSNGPGLAIDTGPVSAEEQNDNGRGNFDFYSYLPNAEVQVDVVPVEMTREEIREADTTQYLLQAGSFQNKEDAEGRRASILLLNMDANVAPGVVAGKTWHRVQVGPFTGRKAAEEARDALSSNNIDTIVLRVR